MNVSALGKTNAEQGGRGDRTFSRGQTIYSLVGHRRRTVDLLYECKESLESF